MNEAYERRMQSLLNDEYEDYRAALSRKPYRGYRINTLKISKEDFFSTVNLPGERSPFSENGFYLHEESGLGATPAYAAGLFYLQEPSASAAVTVLRPQPGMKILDLCAAPGSKTTQILEMMQGRGMLVANEINPKRAQILAENVERSGAVNCFVLNETPQNIADAGRECFDQVLCDAPCSGEGMFRKDPDAEKQWTEESVKSCALRQRRILDSAYLCLRQGGVLVYSTCTFSPEEDEETIAAFLHEHPDMTVVTSGVSFGRPGIAGDAGTGMALRIYPMDGGEGHFVCRMQKAGAGPAGDFAVTGSERIAHEAEMFLKDQLQNFYPHYLMKNGILYGGANPFYDFGRCHIVRSQVKLGELRNGRFEPDHHFYMSAWSGFRRAVELDDAETAAFLRGETISVETAKGYCAVQWKGHAVGHAKSDGRILKNKYPKQLRMR
jgi:NOL1/NOP2/sun family putative RNA methylase